MCRVLGTSCHLIVTGNNCIQQNHKSWPLRVFTFPGIDLRSARAIFAGTFWFDFGLPSLFLRGATCSGLFDCECPLGTTVFSLQLISPEMDYKDTAFAGCINVIFDVNSHRLSLASPNSELPLELPLNWCLHGHVSLRQSPSGCPHKDSSVFLCDVLGLYTSSKNESFVTVNSSNNLRQMSTRQSGER